MMIEYGEEFWGDRWPALYDVLGGNPLAAMPSLHFATTLMGAHLLTEVGPVAGAVGWTYTALLGLALVYLGEHYAVDLLAGAVLAETVRAGAPHAAPVVRAAVRGLGSLQRLAAVG
jgi:small basic protein